MAEEKEQHYEVPTEFYDFTLGEHKKYSCCLFDANVNNLSIAEESMLSVSCERAEIEDGMQILELGCGWGSLTLWLGEHYPQAKVTAVSNSTTQKTYSVRILLIQYYTEMVHFFSLYRIG